MPQLDIVPFASQYIGFMFLFFCSYFIFLKYFLPLLSQWMKVEAKHLFHHLLWLNSYQFALFKKDINSSKLIAYSASVVSSLELLIERMELLVQGLIDVLFCTAFEKHSVYLCKQLFTLKSWF